MKLNRIVFPVVLIAVFCTTLLCPAADASSTFPLDIHHSVHVVHHGVVERGVMHIMIHYYGDEEIMNATLGINNLRQLIFLDGEIELDTLIPNSSVELSVIYELDRSGPEELSFDELNWVLAYESQTNESKIQVVQSTY
jgi:hypothetical protein